LFNGTTHYNPAQCTIDPIAGDVAAFVHETALMAQQGIIESYLNLAALRQRFGYQCLLGNVLIITIQPGALRHNRDQVNQWYHVCQTYDAASSHSKRISWQFGSSTNVPFPSAHSLCRSTAQRPTRNHFQGISMTRHLQRARQPRNQAFGTGSTAVIGRHQSPVDAHIGARPGVLANDTRP